MNCTWFGGVAQLDLTRGLQLQFFKVSVFGCLVGRKPGYAKLCECSRKDKTIQITCPVTFVWNERKEKAVWLVLSTYLPCKVPVTDIHTPMCMPCLWKSPEFIEHCHCLLHAYLQVLLGLLEVQDSSLITSYLNINGIHRKNRLQTGNQQLLRSWYCCL